MFPSPNLCTILLLYDSVTPNTMMAALQIPQSLEIRCLCINDVVDYYFNWGHLHGSRLILFSLQNLFTHPTLSSLFNILHPSNTPSMQTLQNFNSYPTSYIHTTNIINTFFVKTDDTSVISWIQDITSILSAVILHNNLFPHATLWILRTCLPNSLKDFGLDIISHYLQTSWTFYMLLSRATNFGECISSHWDSFHINEKSEKQAYLLTKPPAFTLPLGSPCIFFKALMSPSRSIIVERD